MAATTVDRDTVADYIERELTFPLAAATTIPAGALVCTNAAGAAVNAADVAALKVQGRAAHSASTVLGDTIITVQRGRFWYLNDGTVTQAIIGAAAPIRIIDNQTVGNASTNNIFAGYAEELGTVNGVSQVAVAILGGRPEAA